MLKLFYVRAHHRDEPIDLTWHVVAHDHVEALQMHRDHAQDVCDEIGIDLEFEPPVVAWPLPATPHATLPTVIEWDPG